MATTEHGVAGEIAYQAPKRAPYEGRDFAIIGIAFLAIFVPLQARALNRANAYRLEAVVFTDKRAKLLGELLGTEYNDGWGAHCYSMSAKADGNDRSFRSWTCAEGLTCQMAGKTSRMGMCFIKTTAK